MEDRYGRQRQLAEVGDAGQARLCGSEAVVSGRGGAALIELSYLHRAGVGRVAVDTTRTPEPFPHAAHFRFAAARDVAAGAWRALSFIRRELGQAP